eukprot:1160958-Pelagomonas_calceolata.AAC.2
MHPAIDRDACDVLKQAQTLHVQAKATCEVHKKATGRSLESEMLAGPMDRVKAHLPQSVLPQECLKSYKRY